MADYKINCGDYTRKDGSVSKGCGKEIIFKLGDDGRKHPCNLDGSPHKHFGQEKDVKSFKEEVKSAVQTPDIESIIRKIAQEEIGKAFDARGLGVASG
jgi:hypothetical protein